MVSPNGNISFKFKSFIGLGAMVWVMNIGQFKKYLRLSVHRYYVAIIGEETYFCGPKYSACFYFLCTYGCCTLTFLVLVEISFLDF